jgi:MFS family permease
MKHTVDRPVGGAVNFPFRPSRIPFFYGWVILALGSLSYVMTVPGQTVGVSVFTDFLIDELKLSRVHLSLAYLIGTISSALLLSTAGKVYDRRGARAVGTTVALLFGALLLILSQAPSIVFGLTAIFGAALKGGIALCLMSVGFFALRFLAQGVLSLISRNMVMKWFDARRGFVNGILGLCVAFGFSYSPRVLNTLIENYTWKGTWKLLGLFIGVGFALIFFILARDNPAECGLQPDGTRPVARKQRAIKSRPERDFTLAEARRSFTFWMYTLVMGLCGLYITGLTFHVVSIFAEAGMDRITAVSIFFPASVISVSLNFLLNWASDHIKLKYILIVEVVGLLIGSGAFVFLNPGLTFVLLIIGNGIIFGAFGVVSTVTWPRFFGATHLGAISGFAMAWMVGGSAVGPYLFSLSLRYTGSYAGAGYISLGAAALLLALSLRAERPAVPGTRRKG